MPRLAANLSLLFPDLEFRGRFAAAARAGFRHVEYQYPYAWPSAKVADWARGAGVEVVLHNLPAGNAARGDRGIACLPDRVSEFREGVERAIEYARAAGCPRLNCLAGIAPVEMRHFETLVENVRFAARKLHAAGLALMLEPVSTHAMPGFFLSRSHQAIEVLDAAGEDNAFLQYDLYHMQMMEGDVLHTIARLLPRIGHMQVAGVPNRHEPDSGELNITWLFAQIDRLGYSGFIGCEYNPAGDTASGLGWARPYLQPLTDGR